MAMTIYIDGGAGDDPKFGFFVKESGKSSYERAQNLTNMEAEYMALKLALEWLRSEGAQAEEITIYSDSQTMVSQVRHEYGINNDSLRALAMEIWPIIGEFSSLDLKWIRRRDNLAGKMLGS